MLRALFANRFLLRSMVVRDLRGRYAGSAMGLAWTVIHPIVLLALYTFVFGFVLRIRANPVVDPLKEPWGGSETLTFTLYLLCGLLPWLAFQESVLRAQTSVVESANLIKKMPFPSEILPVTVTLTAFLHFLAALALYTLFAASVGSLTLWPFVYLPLVLVLQLAFSLGLAFLACAGFVYFRDLGHILGLLLHAWFYLTPIVYPPNLVPAWIQPVFRFNPMHHLMKMYRAIFFHQSAPPGRSLIAFTLAALVCCWVGAKVFASTKRGFADVV